MPSVIVNPGFRTTTQTTNLVVAFFLVRYLAIVTSSETVGVEAGYLRPPHEGVGAGPFFESV